jgi:hypothetical protein
MSRIADLFAYGQVAHFADQRPVVAAIVVTTTVLVATGRAKG